MTTTTATDKTLIRTILVLKAGETPSDHKTNAGELAGPWGVTETEAISAYESDTGFKVLEHWRDGDTLWIVSDESA